MKSHYKAKTIPEQPAKVFNATRRVLKRNPTIVFDLYTLAAKAKCNPKSVSKEIKLLRAMGEVQRIYKSTYDGRWPIFVRWCTPAQKDKKQ